MFVTDTVQTGGYVLNMEKLYDVEKLMLELLEDNVDVTDWKVTDRGREIIDEISDHAEQTRIFRENKDRGEIFSELSAQRVFVYMLDRIVNAPTSIHRDVSVLLIMPFVRQKLQEEEADVAACDRVIQGGMCEK